MRHKIFLLLCVFCVGVGIAAVSFFTENSFARGAEKCEQNMPHVQQCYEALIMNTLEKKGLPRALETVAYLYTRNTEFAASCHGNVHELGEAAYRLYQKGAPVDITPQSSYCGYGFFHGFMEALIAAEGDPASGREFCLHIGEKLKQETADAAGACFHGIGHGAVDGTDPRDWGNPQAMLAQGLLFCDAVTGLSKEDIKAFGPAYRCLTGAYNALEILSQDVRYQLHKLAVDPFGFCRQEPAAYRPGCYTNMIPAVLRITKNNFVKAAESIITLPDEWGGTRMRESIITDLFVEHIRLHSNDISGAGSSGLRLCRDIPDEYQSACISGVAIGFLKYGEPTHEYEQALTFCRHEGLSEEERAVCYSYVLSRLRNLYSVEKTAQVCSLAPSEYARYCNPL